MNMVGTFSLSLRTVATVLALGCTRAVRPLAAADSPVTVTQITHGPSHHYFGHIGQSRTVPWSADGRYIPRLL